MSEHLTLSKLESELLALTVRDIVVVCCAILLLCKTLEVVDAE